MSSRREGLSPQDCGRWADRLSFGMTRRRRSVATTAARAAAWTWQPSPEPDESPSLAELKAIEEARQAAVAAAWRELETLRTLLRYLPRRRVELQPLGDELQPKAGDD